MARLTPMLDQYYRLKAEQRDAILMFRLGDFYEMFEEDAETAARELEITLTSRDGGQGRRMPMCGVPHHAVKGYVGTLVSKGYRVAICEQMEDPKQAKGVVRREIVRVVTPGTAVDEAWLDERKNNYLAAVAADRQKDGWTFGLAVADLSTGEFQVTEFDDARDAARLKGELARFLPSEVLLSPDIDQELQVRSYMQDEFGATTAIRSPDVFRVSSARKRLLDHFRVVSLEPFGCQEMGAGIGAAGAVLDYVVETSAAQAAALTALRTYTLSDGMLLDATARRNLELTETMRSGEQTGSLLATLDRTVTPMGRRLLRGWVEQPLCHLDRIEARQEAIAFLTGHDALRRELQGCLKPLYDIQRLVGRAAAGTANARDLLSLGRSLKGVPDVRTRLAGAMDGGATLPGVRRVLDDLVDVEEVAASILDAIADNPPATLTEGGLIREGFRSELDEIRTAKRDGKEWITRLEASERGRTGIKSLKVGYNKVFGYYIEVSRPNLHLVPEAYQRRQTLSGAERFITPELKEQEALILGAEERLSALEFELFVEIRTAVAERTADIQRVATAVATLDVFLSLAEVAVVRGYARPVVNESDRLEIAGGRHPMVEVRQAEEGFVPNDTAFDTDRQILLIMGPNMGGKSTYLRQVALIVLMAQMGSFVPADSAEIGLVDRIFTRIGATDDLSKGQSTFMVEMIEVAHILRHATARSLVLLDEVGRGTSTYDGVGIAWAVTEYLHNDPVHRPKTLFATHYHELTSLTGRLERLRLYRVEVREEGDGIHFLHTLAEGGADRSYGVEVARLAGLPVEVLDNARQVLARLEGGERLGGEADATERQRTREACPAGARPRASGAGVGRQQLSLFAPKAEPPEWVKELAATSIDELTPLQGLNLLDAWRRLAMKTVSEEGDERGTS